MMALAERIAFLDDEYAARKSSRSVSACLVCWFVRCMFLAGVLFWLILGAYGLLALLPDAQAVLDTLSPTAAQARDAGWVALSEGR